MIRRLTASRSHHDSTASLNAADALPPLTLLLLVATHRSLHRCAYGDDGSTWRAPYGCYDSFWCDPANVWYGDYDSNGHKPCGFGGRDQVRPPRRQPNAWPRGEAPEFLIPSGGSRSPLNHRRCSRAERAPYRAHACR